ncbi:hypothetical protein ACFFWB_26635 [Flavobacterium procerum]|uniref:hypothetical protein n=1 Tax=Flavobacterium procerum TaxID=1455569 RepID=UPI0035E59B3E
MKQFKEVRLKPSFFSIKKTQTSKDVGNSNYKVVYFLQFFFFELPPDSSGGYKFCLHEKALPKTTIN